ncbi:MAG: dihydrodipicolinate synthase family protein [Chthoniobacteraceae bacterium]
MTPHWTGVFPAVTTQFKRDESLDLDGTMRHVEALLESGVQGLIMLGSLGENQPLEPDEKRQVLEATIKHVGGRVPVMSGVAETSAVAATRYVRDAERMGADGFMIMPAMVYKADTREALSWFRTIGGATGLPWMLYNNPLAYPVDITPELMAELDNVKNLVAIKESSGNTRRITELRNVVGDRYAIFTGVDDLMLESAILGIDGWVAGTGIAFPKENQRIWDLTRAGEWDKAREIYRWFQPLLKLDTHIHFVQYIKLCIQEAGLGAEWVRSPRMTIEGAEREQVLKIIRKGIEQRPTLA